MNRSCRDFAQDLPAAALHALERSDDDLLRQHVSSCLCCDRALLEFEAVAAALGAASRQVAPPTTLKSRVIAAACGCHRSAQETLT